MITLSPVKSSGQALSYFSKDNYYTEHEGLEESEWFGKGAQSLGLEGKVDKKEFFEVLNGNIDGQELGRKSIDPETGELEISHRPGLDVTFSAPKSVSLMAEVAGDIGVREAHEEAVKSTLAFIEREYSNTRQMENGELNTVKTGNLIVAMFRHNTSRELDPQTHTHALVMNATKREDGEWRSHKNDEIWKDQNVIGAYFNGQLASNLQAIGLELERVDKRGNFEIAGISREQIEAFSQRRAEMEAAMAERGLDIRTASAQQKEAAALGTRDRKGDVDHGELIAEWKQRAAALGIDFDAIQERAAITKENGGPDKADELTGRGAMEFAAAHLIEREAVVSKAEILRTAFEHGTGRVAPEAIEKAFDALEKGGQLVRLPDGNYTTKKMLGSEEWSVDQVRATRNQGGLMLGASAVRAKLVGIEERQGFAYTEGQRQAIETVMTSHDRFVGVQGLAGVGKTTMLKGLNELAKESGYTVRGMTPTGAASKVMTMETAIPSDTVSMFMIKERQLNRDIEFVQQNAAPDFTRQKELWIVDESSFLSQRQKAQLDNMANKAGAKVVYLGDKNQLQGVEAGKPFELAQNHGMETAHMTEISRQKTPELKAVIDTLTGRDRLQPGERLTNVELKHNSRAFAAMNAAGMVKVHEADAIIDAIVKDVTSMSKAERERSLVITPYNKFRTEINEGVRAALKANGELPANESNHRILVSEGNTRAMIKESQYYEPGQIVRFGRDYKAIAAAKGEYMTVAAKAPGGVVILEKDDGTTIAWEPRKHNSVEVYAAEQRGLVEGDLIRLTRNEGLLKNGEVARIVGIEGSVATLEMTSPTGNTKHIVDLDKNQHWDHAYAVTVHASQGSTKQDVKFHIPIPEEREGESDRAQQKALDAMAKIFGDRGFYVGATRASHDLTVYTSDLGKAAEIVGGVQDKTSALETLENHQTVSGAKVKTTDVER